MFILLQHSMFGCVYLTYIYNILCLPVFTLLIFTTSNVLLMLIFTTPCASPCRSKAPWMFPYANKCSVFLFHTAPVSPNYFQNKLTFCVCLCSSYSNSFY